ncbi:MAG: protein-glutamine glutaminase family protein [Bdellovibrionales bacterium]|nr:protein-glutamine glutaminase family protein [Bdellovibrionales bacterium]
MLRRSFLSTLLVFATASGFSNTSFAASAPATSDSSAARPSGVPAELLIRKAQERSRPQRHRLSDRSQKAAGIGPVVWAKSTFDEATWSRVPAISEADLQASFEMVREEKFFTDEVSRKRRATWLYPDDGCFVRATVADGLIAKLLQPPPAPTTAVPTAKIFAFGNLRVQTANSPSGEVEWWYHVAAIAKVKTSGAADEYYVYDPAISPKAPMPVKEWLTTMVGPNLKNIEIAICAGGAYDPYSHCEANDPSTRQYSLERAHREAHQFLPEEWDRLEVLGRDPNLELGSNPPW